MNPQEKPIPIRYSKQITYYSLLLGGISICFIVLIMLFLFFLNTIGIDPDGLNMNPYWEEHLGIMFAITILGAIAIIIISFLLPLKVALKATDKKGVAIFDSEKVYFELGSKNISIPYNNIQKIVFTTVSTRFKTGGPPLYRLKIKTNGKQHFIQCSFQEAWQCKRKKAKPTIWNCCNRLSIKTGIAVEHTFNTWG